MVKVQLASGNWIDIAPGELRAVETFQRSGKKAGEPAVQFGVRLHLTEPFTFANGTEAMHSQAFVDVLFAEVGERDAYAEMASAAMSGDDGGDIDGDIVH